MRTRARVFFRPRRGLGVFEMPGGADRAGGLSNRGARRFGELAGGALGVLCRIAGGVRVWCGVEEVVCVPCKPECHETEICVRAAGLCAPVHVFVSVDDVESLPLYQPATQSMHVG